MLVCDMDARVVQRIVGEFNHIDIDRSGKVTAMELFNFYSVMDTEFNRRAMTIMDDQPPSNMSLDVLEYVAAVYNFCTHGRRRRASTSTPRGRRVDAAESSRRRRGAVASTPRSRRVDAAGRSLSTTWRQLSDNLTYDTHKPLGTSKELGDDFAEVFARVLVGD